MANILPFPEYAPDISPFGEEESQIIQNTFARKDGYGPVPSQQVFSTALASVCRGYFKAYNSDGTVSIFAATSNKLYKLNGTDLTWTDVSKGAATYTAIPTTDQWQFAQFNNFVIAVQINTVPQVFDLTSSTAFADLGGSPPQARYITVVNRFVVLSGLSSTSPYRIVWSGLNAVTTWTSGINGSDFQDLPDGGIVRVVGGGEYGLITQDAAIRRMTFAPGTSYTFYIEKLVNDAGIYAPLSLVRAGDRLFYYGTNGFQMLAPGAYPQPIGRERVDRTFLADLDSSNLQLMIGVSDPTATRVFWAYKSKGGMANSFDKVLCYDWTLDRWSLITGWSGQYMSSLSNPGTTLEALDSVASGKISITGAANNGSGAIRLAIAANNASWVYGLADTGHNPGDAGSTNLSDGSQNTIEVYGVTGTTEANGNWRYTYINSTHIDLIGSTFTNAYGGGGTIGGAIDALTFPMDSLVSGSVSTVTLFDTSNKLNFLNGSNLQALLDTAEHEMDGARRVRVKGLRPDTDAATCFGSVGARENIQNNPTYSTEQAVNIRGRCPANTSTRLARARIRIPAGTSWSFISGVEPFFTQEGLR